jgi:hypothetical protein
VHLEWRRRGGDDTPPGDPLPLSDDAVSTLFGGRPEAGERWREHMHWLAAWVRATDDDAAAATRMRFAVLHPEADPASTAELWTEMGRPHAILARGGGDPRDLALVLDLLGNEAGVTTSLRWEGQGLYVDLGGDGWRVGPCGDVVAADGSVGSPIGPGQAAALSLVNGVGRALRSSAWEDAGALAEAAAVAWPGGPDVASALGISAAADGRGRAPPVEVRRTTPAATGRRKLRVAVAPPPEPETIVVTAPAPVAEARVAMLGLDGETRWLAAWWARRAGNADLAVELLAGREAPADLPEALAALPDALSGEGAARADRLDEAWIAQLSAQCPGGGPLYPGPPPRTP